jgi:hypothetical protein
MYFSVPVLRVAESYSGSVSEAGGKVEVEPPIRADGGPICGYRILATRSGKIPFEVRKRGNYSNGVRSTCQCSKDPRHDVFQKQPFFPTILRHFLTRKRYINVYLFFASR